MYFAVDTTHNNPYIQIPSKYLPLETNVKLSSYNTLPVNNNLPYSTSPRLAPNAAATNPAHTQKTMGPPLLSANKLAAPAGPSVRIKLHDICARPLVVPSKAGEGAEDVTNMNTQPKRKSHSVRVASRERRGRTESKTGDT